MSWHLIIKTYTILSMLISLTLKFLLHFYSHSSLLLVDICEINDFLSLFFLTYWFIFIQSGFLEVLHCFFYPIWYLCLSWCVYYTCIKFHLALCFTSVHNFFDHFSLFPWFLFSKLSIFLWFCYIVTRFNSSHICLGCFSDASNIYVLSYHSLSSKNIKPLYKYYWIHKTVHSFSSYPFPYCCHNFISLHFINPETYFYYFCFK